MSKKSDSNVVIHLNMISIIKAYRYQVTMTVLLGLRIIDDNEDVNG